MEILKSENLLIFLNILSRFEGEDNIQSDHIKTFTSQDPNLLQNIIDWIKTIS